MAKIDDLLDDIPDPRLRSELRQAVNELRSARTFGLVFEDHIPEEVALPGLPVRTGSIVQNRTRPDDTTKYEVVEVDGDEAQVRPFGNGDETTTVPVRNLMVVRRFGEPIYPGLTQVGEVRRGPDDKPAHAVINAENFHALQMLTYTHAGKVDVIYIDPPYNTGARDWKYNNRFVDANDQWRHSKWLSMMEKRLHLARALLSPDGVLIVTIDEHEVHHLGVLLEQTFPDARLQMVSAVISSQGSTRDGMFSRADEHIYFVFLGDSRITNHRDDMLNEDGTYSKKSQLWFQYIRGGKSGKGTRREDSKNLFFPLFADPRTGRIVSVGDPLPLEASRHDVQVPEGLIAIWPLFDDGGEGRWRTGVDRAREWLEQGYLRLGKSSKTESGWSAMSIRSGTVSRIEKGEVIGAGRRPDGSAILEEVAGVNVRAPKTVWNKVSHNAGWHGTKLLNTFLPDRSFPFPKSLYVVVDTLSFVVRERPDAVILDFFAGSGTTLHAVAVLNALDSGQRRCILVTNNDLSEQEAQEVFSRGAFRGDAEYEKYGIFESVTKSRVEAVLSGRRPDGSEVPGSYRPEYLDQAYADGLDENAAFFRLDYLDPDVVSVGRQYSAIAPLLWLAAGSVGGWADRDGDEPWSVPESSNYAVLFDEDRFAEFKTLVEGSDRIGHVWLVTNSSQSFAEMRAQLPDRLEVQMLYRDYLSNFRVNTAETFS